MDCARCGDPLPVGTPNWQTMCRDCFITGKHEERATAINSALTRALTAEAKVEAAKILVTQMQSKMRSLEGQLRAAQGNVGLRMNVAPVAGAAGLDRPTLERMRRLCHPDKHNGSQASHEVTQLLNSMIDNK